MYCPKCGEKKQDKSLLCSNCEFDFGEVINSSANIKLNKPTVGVKGKRRLALAIILVILAIGTLIALINSTVNTVDITLPASWYEDDSDLDLRELAREAQYKKVVRNADGSVTITMSKKKHREKLNELATLIDEAFADLIEAPQTPYIKSIRQSNNYATITIDVEKEGYENEFFELTHLMLAMLASMYQRFTADPQPINIIIQDIDTGEVLLNFEP